MDRTELERNKMNIDSQRLVGAQGIANLWSIIAFLGTLAVMVAIATNIYRFGGNWDEYNFLAKILMQVRGELDTTFQTFFVHGFRWLSAVDGNPLDKIESGRVVSWIASAGTLAALYRVGREFLPQSGAFVALFSYVSFSYVIEHLASFRYDPFTAFLLVSSGASILTRRTAGVIIAGVLFAISTLVTVKSVIYLPALSALLFYRIDRDYGSVRLHVLVRTAFQGIAASLFTLIVLGYLHSQSIASSGESATFLSKLGAAVNKVGLEAGVFPRMDYALHVANISYMHILLFIGGLVAAFKGIIRCHGAERIRLFVLLMLATPVLSLLFYRNAFSYFYVFMLPFPALMCGYAFDITGKKVQSKWAARLLCAVSIAGLGHSAYFTFNLNSHRDQAVQRSVLAGIEEIFPDPVAYIDRCGMISEYQKIGFFMSTWGLESYRARGEPVMRELILKNQPKFVLANHRGLVLHLDISDGPYSLFPADVEALRANYIPHWGPVYVPGKYLVLDEEGRADFEILIAGEYTLENADDVKIDGKLYRAGDVIHLEKGHYKLDSGVPGAYLLLRWGSNLKVPDFELPDGPLFNGLITVES